jgi:predicted nuclease with TOPRIM domain
MTQPNLPLRWRSAVGALGSIQHVSDHDQRIRKLEQEVAKLKRRLDQLVNGLERTEDSKVKRAAQGAR